MHKCPPTPFPFSQQQVLNWDKTKNITLQIWDIAGKHLLIATLAFVDLIHTTGQERYGQMTRVLGGTLLDFG